MAWNDDYYGAVAAERLRVALMEAQALVIQQRPARTNRRCHDKGSGDRDPHGRDDAGTRAVSTGTAQTRSYNSCRVSVTLMGGRIHRITQQSAAACR